MNDQEHTFIVMTLFNKHKEEIEKNQIHSLQKFFDRKGKSITPTEWTILTQYTKYFLVKKCSLNGLEICCLWMGLEDHLYESVIFDQKNEVMIYKISLNEKDALHEYEKLGFWVDQKIFTKKKNLPKEKSR